MAPRRPPLPAALPILLLVLLTVGGTGGLEIQSKSRVERCARDSGAGGSLSCERKIVLDLAVPSGSSGGEASLVARVAEAEENDTLPLQRIRDPPIITVTKSAVYALYDLRYMGVDVAYRPEERYVKTRKCEPDAGADIVQGCERLWDGNGHVIEHTEPVCCPCGPEGRVPSSCGNIFAKITKGKANTAHCLRFTSDWFHVWAIESSSLWFDIRVQVKKGSSLSEVVVSPANKTVVSRDNFLRVNLVGDFASYRSIPSFEGLYLVTPRKKGAAGSGQPQDLGNEYSKWMLLERVRFTLDGSECNKIGVKYEAFQNQPDFCSSPLSSCLYSQLWNFWEADQNQIKRNQPPQYVVEGRFQRINQHPGAGTYTFSVGITEVLNSNLLVELSADDIEYVYHRSPGKIININVPTFEALSQIGTANVTTKNTGTLVASYSLTFDCSPGISKMEEQCYNMKPDEVITRSFVLHSTTDQEAKYRCKAILKASNSSELDRAECQFSTKPTVFDNGTQIGALNGDKMGGIWGAIIDFWRNLWSGVIDFFTGRSCRTKCSSFLDLSCHIQYLCIGWLVMCGLLLFMLPAVAVLLWLLHQKGFFDPVYDWWEDLQGPEPHDRAHRKGGHRRHHHHRHSHRHGNEPPHPHRHHAHHQSHHHVLHRHGGGGHAAEPWAAEGHRLGRHDPALGVQHREAGHKHRASHGKAVAAAALRLDGPRGVEDAVELREIVRHGRERHHWRAQ